MERETYEYLKELERNVDFSPYYPIIVSAEGPAEYLPRKIRETLEHVRHTNMRPPLILLAFELRKYVPVNVAKPLEATYRDFLPEKPVERKKEPSEELLLILK